MEKNTVITKILVIIGLILVWLTVLTPIVLAVAALFVMGRFLLDYMMPAEMFAAALGGAILLFLAAVRVKERRILIGGASGAAIFMLFGAQLTAVLTGMASGEREAVGLPFIAAMGMLILYDLLLIPIGIGGILLLRDMIRDSRSSSSSRSARQK
ncbi:MAG: hypothetical protein K9L21_03680 [Spirochaetia bacterium]|nr:hypothetical protein [Spirochaetia bacterium]